MKKIYKDFNKKSFFNKIFSIIETDRYKIVNLLGFKISFKKYNKDFKYNIDYLKKLIDKNSVISFDIFDTLLLRPYAKPSNVFQHLEEINNAIGFSVVREQAEYNLRKYKDIEYGNYNEIYSILPADFQFLKGKEIQLEKDTIYANPQMKQIFDYANSLNKIIILTSDMYFSSSILEDILKKNGITEYKKIYVSSELRKAKWDGSMYNHIIQDLNISPQSILHIGNNKYSDYEMAINSHLNAFHYIEPMEQFFYKYKKFQNFLNKNTDSLTAGIIIGILVKKYIENNINNFDYWKYFGYFLGGPVCYGISKFLYNQVNEKNINEVIFVARDGYTIQKIFNLFNKDNKIKTHYVYANRVLNIIINMDYSNNFHYDDRLNSLITICKELNPELALKTNKLITDKEKQEFIKNNFSLINSISIEMKYRYLKYLKKFDIKDNIALFDIATGNFSALKLLKNVLDIKNIHDIYWITNYKNEHCITYQKNYINMIQNPNVLEFIITAPELPIKYIDKNGNFIRINNKYEMDRMTYYSIIFKEEVNFSKDLLSTFKHYPVEFICDDLINLINLFFNIIDDDDKKYLKSIKYSINEMCLKYIDLVNLEER